MTRDLSRLLRPNSIAVIGGGAVCRYVKENCQKIGFDGPVWHVHPSRGDFADVSGLPAALDVAFVGVNREATVGIIAQLAEMNAGGAVAYASGFLEAEIGDGAAYQSRLLDAAGDMVLIGPNCFGFLNYLDGAALWPDQQGAKRVGQGVALITQSSNIGINLTMQRRGLPIAYLVTVGNQAQTGLSEIGMALLADERVTALGLHVEGFGSIADFEALCAAARICGKPILVLKAGRSVQAQAATMSHTASIAGSSAGADALLKRLGVPQLATLSEMLEALKVAHVHGHLSSNRIASMSCSGGEASLMADLGAARNVEYPALTKQQSKALSAALGPKVALANPLDYHTYIWADVEKMQTVFSAMMLGDLAIGLIVADFPRADRCSDADWEPVIDAVATTANTTGKPMAIVASLPDTMSEATAERLIALGVVPFLGMDEAIAAVEATARRSAQQPHRAPVLLPGADRDTVLVDERTAKSRLAAFGLDTPKSITTNNGPNVGAAAKTLRFPVVLKGVGIAHKTEAGVVALNINNAVELTEIASKMDCSDLLIEEMVEGSVVELLIGVLRDPAHGFVLTLGAGGTQTELLKDVQHLLVPAAPDEIDDALAALRIGPLFDGFRGAPATDRRAIHAAINAVQDFVIAQASSIEEVEINPLICTPTRAVAADALLRIGDPDVG